MRVVIDTNILVSATGWEGNARELLRRASKGDFTVVISDEILEEYLEVIRRDKFSFLDKKKVTRFVLLMLEFVEVLSVKSRVRAVREDPEDDMVLSCAKAAGARLIVTGDSHLLKLGKWSGIRIVSPGEALDLLD